MIKKNISFLNSQNIFCLKTHDHLTPSHNEARPDYFFLKVAVIFISLQFSSLGCMSFQLIKFGMRMALFVRIWLSSFY